MAAPLVDEDVDDEEEILELESAKSGHTCTLCRDDVRLEEEVFLLRIVHPFVTEAGLSYFDIIDDHGFYKYPPAYFCFDCWEDEQEELETIQEDVPPVLDPEGVILCDICSSDILQGEAMGLLQLAELQLSKRQPSNCASACFMAIDDPKHLCIACVTHLENNQQDSIWSDEIDPVPNHEVCIEGIFERCWRGGNCACPKRNCET